MQGPQTDESRLWHRLTTDETLSSLQADDEHGLTAEEAQARLKQYGPNTITPRKGKGPLRRVLEQLSQPLVIILVIAGTVTAALQHWVDSGVIFGVVVVNTVVGFLQESKAVKAIEALARSMSAEATVVRNGRRVRLSAADLVPGDVIVLQAGDKIPADLRLTYSRDLNIDESALTGESVPVEKMTDSLPEDTVLADRVNMAYASTLVTSGQGTGVVVMTGDYTEVGRISDLIAKATDIKTPLTRKIAQFSKWLLVIIIGLAAITAVVGLVRGQPAVDMFMAAVALAVGAIPEGLPAAVTIVLAIGVSRMARRRAIIRKLPAVETLGSTTVICSDKTGTLTENQMTVQHIATPDLLFKTTGGGYTPEGTILDPHDEVVFFPDDGSPQVADSLPEDGSGGQFRHGALLEVLRAGALCNESSLYREEGQWRISGDPTEGALIVSAAKAGLTQEEVGHHFPRMDTVPFESEHQYMATLHRVASWPHHHDSQPSEAAGGLPDDGRRVAYVKGAVEKVLARCSSEMHDDGSLTPLDADRIEKQAMDMASQGLRVLAFARKAMPHGTHEMTHEDVETELTFLGLQSMIDPPREEAKRAIKACHAAGVQVKMITGDHALTAAAIAQQLSLGKPGCESIEDIKPVTGVELAAISDADLADVAEETFVFARVTPEQKLRLVTALQSRGHIVAMTGDGVNDAPALRQADIGVAMGMVGTEVAKEAADMILTDDNFASIEAAVEEGRGVFDNLRKFIGWTLPTNLAEGLVILAAIVMGMALPIMPVQILWINMTTAILLGLMLAFEPKEPGIMKRPPRPPAAALLDAEMIGRILIVGVLLTIGAFALFEWAERTAHTTEQARTIASNVLVFGEMAYLFNCRSLTQPSWRVSLRTNKFVMFGVTAMTALQLLFTYLPGMNRLFGTEPIRLLDWAWIIGIAVGVHVVVEIEKGIRRRRDRGQVSPTNAC